ncbi:hypothetical protein CRUP_021830 [Coryphaenoides rupestris]|nr:hypothetical protein CRUP_021830 [Coryphaenoides rupestris]
MDALLCGPLSVAPTPSDPQHQQQQPPLLASQPQAALLAPFAQQQQQQLALSQPLPVMTIPLPSMGTSITTGTTTSPSPVMASAAGLNFINVGGLRLTLMSGPAPMLGPSLNLSGILPPGGVMPAMQSTSQPGSHFGLNSSTGLGPLNLLQIPARPLIFNSLQAALSVFPPAEPVGHFQPPTAGELGDQGLEQSLGNQQTAVINLGVGGFMSPQGAVAILAAPNAAANGFGSGGPPGGGGATAYQRQPAKKTGAGTAMKHRSTTSLLGSGTPKPPTPSSTTSCSTPHPMDALLCGPLSVAPTPSDPQHQQQQPPLLASQPQAALLAPFAQQQQQQLALSQPLPVMTIPLPSMGTSITTGTTTSPSPVMASAAGLNFINVVGSVCTMGPAPMLGPSLNLSGILPPGGVMPAMQSTSQPVACNPREDSSVQGLHVFTN